MQNKQLLITKLPGKKSGNIVHRIKKHFQGNEKMSKVI